MGIFDRVSRVVRANVNDMINKAEDPEKVLEQAIIDMQQDLVKLRQAVVQTMATQKRTEQQYNNNLAEVNKWQQRAQLALSKGDENLAKEALVRKKSYNDTANVLKQQLDQQSAQTEQLKRNLIALESKISEAKTKKDMLKARASAAKANQELNGTLNNMNTSSALSAFEQMEDKVLQLEARSQAGFEIAGSGLENEFAKLEAGSDVDDELAAMKAQLSGASPEQQAALPKAQPQENQSTNPVVDAELEELRNQLNKM